VRTFLLGVIIYAQALILKKGQELIGFLAEGGGPGESEEHVTGGSVLAGDRRGVVHSAHF
jgi:hypothetical protein